MWKQDAGPRWLRGIKGNGFRDPRLLPLPRHRKALNSFTWDVWFSLTNSSIPTFRLPALRCKTLCNLAPPLASSEWFLRAACNAASRATALILPPIRLNSPHSHCASFLKSTKSTLSWIWPKTQVPPKGKQTDPIEGVTCWEDHSPYSPDYGKQGLSSPGILQPSPLSWPSPDLHWYQEIS